MQIKQLLISAVLAPAALAATSPQTVFYGFENLHKRILSTHECLKSFNGGMTQSLTCGYELYNVLMASGSSRKDLADLDSVPADQVQTYLNHYHGIRSAVADTLSTAFSKVDSIESQGFKMFSQVLLRNFASERAIFETLTKSKIPVANHSEIAGPVDSLKVEFEKTLTVFS
ncbi:uncharacterized protein N7473_011400 [Penicillium subrubescens]|uniref:Cell wall galactomannoprotein n=1 Tax=Penicillium subrubescens TaxID=1316194 RepID=A0A1Q5UH34_9EURO|nr:uncharacterized protein N7473_011400 [Penicillium subrubescens]KAJ5880347.1 hypothetical protein N7473_011400 [Penicillium subrubescens]OKP11764.1 hypothetical protein PENSUB_2630 [Penicillium subrubescens]